MDYRDDDRWLLGEREQTLSETSANQRLFAAILFAAIMATGFIEHGDVSVMEGFAEEEKPLLCPKFNAKGDWLKSSMVMETYVKGAPKPHECNYGGRS